MNFEEEDAQRAIEEAALAQAGGMDFTDEETIAPVVQGETEEIIGDPVDPMDSVLALAGNQQRFRTAAALPDMPAPSMEGVSDVTLRQRQEAQEDEGGFDWARAFFAGGKGDLGAFDAEQARRRAAPGIRAAALQEQFDREEARQLARAAMDPMSQQSKAKQAEYANEMTARAQMMAASGMNDLAATFAEEAKRASSMSASQIDRSQFGKVFGDALKFSDIQAKREALPAKLAMDERKVAAAELQARNTGAQGWARIQEAKQEHELKREDQKIAREEKKAAAEERAGDKIPESTGTEKYNARRLAIKQLDRAIELLPQIRYTGGGAEFVNNLLSSAPGKLDVRNDAEREFVGLVKSLTAAERNKLFGGALSAFDIKDAGGFLAAIGKNKETIAANLARVRDAATELNSVDEKLYPGLVKKLGPSSAATPSAAPSADPRVELAKKALADPNASPAHKEAAKRILEKAGQ
jgi:hypothetical protein